MRRTLAHEPISARPDARLYRAAKFVRRHRAGVAMAGVTMAALSVGIGVATVEAQEARAQRVQAEGLVEYMIGDLRKKLEPVGRLDVLDGVGLKALDYYAAQDLDKLDADSLGRRARAFHMIGSLAEKRGHFAEAVRDFQLAADTTAHLLQAHPDDPQRIFDQSQSEYYVGYVQWYRGRLHEAEASFRRYLDLAQRMNRAKPGDHDWQLEDVFSKTNVGIVLTELGRGEEALPLLAQARAEIAQLAKSHPEDAVSEGTILGWSAMTYASLGRDDDAIRTENDKIAAALRAPNADRDQDVQFLVANAHDECARWQRNLGRLDEAQASAKRGLAELEVLKARDPSNVNNIAEIVLSQLVLAGLFVDEGDSASAREQLRQASALQADLMARPTPKRAWRLSHQGRVAEMHGRLASSDDERRAAQASLSAYLEDVYRYESEGGVVPPLDAVVIASVGLTQGDLMATAGHLEQARHAWQAAAKRIRPHADKLLPAAMTQLGQLDLRLGSIQDSRAWADRVLRTTYRHPAFTDLQQRLGPTQLAGGAARP